jgi:hypothetical protein
MIRTIRTRAARLARVLAAAALALGIGVVAVPSFAQPAQAAGQVSISGEPDPNGQSTLQLQGSGFQSVQGGFGGIYVLFGWAPPARTTATSTTTSRTPPGSSSS